MSGPPTSPPRFLVLDGIDGAGKSSQLAAVVDWLRSTGRSVVVCRDPGSTAAGDAIRSILLDRHEIHLAPTAEMLLYMAARAQLVADVIRPALSRGDWVVSDRYLIANIVYQGYAGGLDPETIRSIGGVATGGVMPDLVVVLDVDLETADRRLSRPLDKLETRGIDYRQRLRRGYRAEADRDPARVVMVDASAGVDEVAARIRTVVGARFPELA